MGWSLPYHTHTRDQLVSWLLENQSEPGRCEIIDHSCRGNVLYTVFHNISKQYRFIVVFLLEGPTSSQRKAGEQSWAYKDIAESQGPRVYGCPERLLRQSDTQYTNAVEWREECRRRRRESSQRRKQALTCQYGDRLEVVTRIGWNGEFDETKTVVFQRAYTATFFIGRDTDGKDWRCRWDRVVIRDISTDTAIA
ncbi:hypothetical protein [Kushneria indalinina]|nr:hypothetical protein [Kushneria indalinina]